MNHQIISFYKFAPLPDYKEWQPILLEQCIKAEVKGSILLASEGINGMLAGTPSAIHAAWTHITADERLNDLVYKSSQADDMPFRRMKVRLKKEIVKLGVPGIDPTKEVGTYVPPEEWNDLIADPDVLCIDTRNDFEVEIGTFQNAINPHTESFSDFPNYVNTLDPEKHTKVAMFCTGGIRCEKATALMMAKGFKDVYHLQGGILKYIENIPKEKSLWEGECFVFDDRVTVDHQLEVGRYELCRGCWQPLDDTMKKSPDYEKGVSCSHCAHKLTPARREGRRERHRQIMLK